MVLMPGKTVPFWHSYSSLCSENIICTNSLVKMTNALLFSGTANEAKPDFFFKFLPTFVTYRGFRTL